MWINKVWKEGTVSADLVDPEGFTTLDAKLLSALSNICSGEFARKVNTFKEKESAADRPVRGRQVLLMMDEFFSTNIKHGATYSLKDLFAVKLKGENLRTFISNWDTVNAGITHPPDPWKPCSMNKSIMYAPSSMTLKSTIVPKRELRIIPTNFLLMLYRDTSGGKGLSRTVTGSTAALEVRSRPLPRKKTPFTPKGYCVAWNKGSCTKENCTYKHETPPKKTRKPSRGRSTSREGKDN